ncbi:MAG: O-methyltransferase [Bacteroidetes bacterium]|nr:O-methyltransferase [Bacteroidota bacterium]
MAFSPEILNSYLDTQAAAEDPLLAEVSRETFLKVQMPHMCSGHVQGIFLEMISRMVRPRRILEIGTFTGYATLCLAKGLADDGILYTLDINEELEPIFGKYFQRSGMADKIRFIPGNALETIPAINDRFDLVFIDADKVNYRHYFDLVIDKVNPGGYILSDNVLRDGKVLLENKDKDGLNMHLYNQKLATDPRVQTVIIPIRDGVSFARKL